MDIDSRPFHPEVQQGQSPLSVWAGLATYAPKSGNYVNFYNDASDDATGSSGALHDIARAIQQARHFIFISDWSFHPDFQMSRNGPNDPTIGQMLADWVRSDKSRLVAILTWLHHAKAPDPDNNAGKQRLWELAKTSDVQKRLLWRASARTGIGWSHHQKFVVLDAPADSNNPDGDRVIKAFFGGLDLTKGRFDWPQHLLPRPNDQRGFFRPSDWYNAETKDAADALRQPWHDIHAQIVGPTAWDFIYEFVGRWNRDPEGMGELIGNRTEGDQDVASIDAVWDKLLLLKNPKTQPRIYQDHEPMLGINNGPPRWSAQVYRSIKEDHWGLGTYFPTLQRSPKSVNDLFNWKIEGRKYESSIEQAYMQLIGAANDFIYIESQYFIGSGSQWGRKSVKNRIPETIVKRIKQKAGQDFHVYVVLPMFPEGDPADSGLRAVRQLQWRAIEYMISALGPDWEKYLSFYFLAQWSDKSSYQNPYDPGQITTRKDRLAAAERYMIYVHSKLMIVDDQYLIIGSANLNERSLAGDRDTEICVGLWPDKGEEAHARVQVQLFRRRIWSEHLGAWDAVLFPNPGSSDCVKEVRKRATENYRRLLYFERNGTEGHLMRWPLTLDNQGLAFGPIGYSKTTHIPDYDEAHKDRFEWMPRDIGLAGAFGNLLDLTE